MSEKNWTDGIKTFVRDVNVYVLPISVGPTYIIDGPVVYERVTSP